MIELRDLTKRYGGLIAVDGVSFEVKEGEVCVLIGPSGCGKSTTLKMINRMLEPTSGTVYVDGVDVRDLKPEILRRRIGYVIQYVGLFPHMTVAENIGIVPRLLAWERTRIDKRVRFLIDLMGLDPGRYAEKYPRELSGGEAQRIGVARALAADPPLLLMDEPFGAVDPLNREVLQAEFVKIQRELKKTVIFVTHDLDEAIRIADRVVILREGKLVQHDTPERILAAPRNKFVHDFVGTDRALKRLSRYDVSRIMRKPITVSTGPRMGDRIADTMTDGSIVYIWVVEEGGKLYGWCNTSMLRRGGSLEDAVTRVDLFSFPVREDSSLREALSRMLAEGVKVIPAVDAQGRVVGEVGLRDIERITEEVDSTWAEGR